MGGVKHPLAFTPTRLFGYFSIVSVCLRIAGITPSPKGCAANATTNLHSDKKVISRYDRNVGFPARRFCTLQGGVAGYQQRRGGKPVEVEISLLCLNHELHGLEDCTDSWVKSTPRTTYQIQFTS